VPGEGKKEPRRHTTRARHPATGAIDGKKSSGSAEIVVPPGFRGRAEPSTVRLSIYNVIGYRLGRGGGGGVSLAAAQMCPDAQSDHRHPGG